MKSRVEINAFAQHTSLSPISPIIFLSDLKPQRVPLKTRQTRRCSNCRHILIKPDMKANSSNKQFRIKSLALSFLPLIEISLSTVQPSHMRGGSTFEDRERNRLSKRQSTLLGGGGLGKRNSLIGSSFIGSDSFGDEEVNTEALRKGRTYKFEIDFENPLDDAMIVRLSVAKHRVSTSSSDIVNDSSNSSNKENPESTETKPAPTSSESNTKESNWNLNLSTNSFMIQPYNEMLDLEEDLEEDDINLNLSSKSSVNIGRSSMGGNDGLGLDSIQDDVEDSLDETRELGSGKGTDGISSRISGGNRGKRNNGILKRKGHTTTIGLDLSIGKEARGEIEVSRWEKAASP